MSYLERIRDASYTSPSGKVFTFDVREVARSGEKKASIHEAPEQDSAFVQDLGMGASRFSLQCFFGGEDYDAAADDFFAGLTERGAGTLAHPRWGDVRVLALKWVQKEGLVEGMRQAVFDIEFVRYGSAIWPVSKVNVSTTVAAKLGAIDVTSAAAQMVPASALDAASGAAKARIDWPGILKGVTQFETDLAANIQGLADTVNKTIDDIVANPKAFCEATLALMSAPGNAVMSVYAKVTGYVAMAGALADEVTTKFEAAIVGLQALGILSGAAGAAVAPVSDEATPFGAKRKVTGNGDEAALAAALLLGLAEDVWNKLPVLEATGYEAPLEMVQTIKVALSEAVGVLLDSAVNLPRRRSMILDGDRSPLELGFILYGDPERQDDVIAENDLQGDQIFTVSGGTEVFWYE